MSKNQQQGWIKEESWLEIMDRLGNIILDRFLTLLRA